jgi:hypothetical protein
MSTKTTFKRVALVAVAALGFGTLSAVPSSAVVGGTGSASNYTSAIALSTTSITAVGSDADGTKNAVRFYVDTTNTKIASGVATATADGLQTGETITVSVVGKTATAQALDNIQVGVMSAARSSTTITWTEHSVADTTGSVTSASTASPNYSHSTTAASNNELNRYWFSLRPASDGGAAINGGAYTVRVRLENANGSVSDKTLTVKWVSTIADAGATLTLANSGTVTTGATYAYSDYGYITATLKDANGGRVVTGLATATTAAASSVPGLTANWMTGTTGATVNDTMSIGDAGTTAQDYIADSTSTSAAAGNTCGVDVLTACITLAHAEVLANAANGVYGVYGAVSSTNIPASTTTKIRVRVTGSDVSATLAVTIAPAATATAAGTVVTATATGLKSSDTLARTVVSKALTYNVPLSTSAISLSVDTDGAAGEAVTSNVTWGGSYASANVTPADDTTVVNYVDASGKFTVALENKSAINGGSATVLLTGFASNEAVTLTINWVKAAPTTMTIVEPVSGVYAALKASTIFTVKLTDQFGKAIEGEQIQPSIPGTTSSNYSATTKYAPVTTDASGIATWTLTDAAAVADGTDGVTFTSITAPTVTQSLTITYKAALPAVSQFYGYSNTTFAATASATARATAIPSTGLAGSAGTGVVLKIDRNISLSLLTNDETSATDDMYAIRIRALTSAGVAATGAAVTLTAATGGWVLNTSGLPAASRTTSVDGSGDAYFQILATGTGTLPFTVTSGTATYTFYLVVADQDAAAGRTVAITGATTGTANAAGVPMTATVKDRYGNPVKNVTLTVTASGVGAFMGGSTSQSFTTDKTGTFTFLATSYAADGGSATFSVRATNATDSSAIAGYTATGVKVDSTLAAGVSSATATVTFAAGQNAAEANAQAATDAAAEATDAANAATDAANAAAEAADAATAAAQDAADAVAALSTQVSEMVNALKKQITALTNLVIKIQKKVKA